MKEIKIKCPECGITTTYYRDNTFFYIRLYGLIGISCCIGVIIGFGIKIITEYNII